MPKENTVMPLPSANHPEMAELSKKIAELRGGVKSKEGELAKARAAGGAIHRARDANIAADVAADIAAGPAERRRCCNGCFDGQPEVSCHGGSGSDDQTGRRQQKLLHVSSPKKPKKSNSSFL